MKTIRSLFICLLLAGGFSASAQDIIYKTSGEEINAKVLEISTSRIVYQQPALFQDSLFSLPRQEVFMVKFANGEKELMQLPEEAAAPAEEVRTPSEMLQLGRLDAKRYYTSNKGYAAGAIGGLLFMPSVLVMAAVPPKITLQDVPNATLLANPYYYEGYRRQAHKRKIGKVAIGGGVGFLTMLLLASASMQAH